jgi:DNA mismatch repair protein MutL
MSDIIQLLPDHVANQIAAGEVVQRPASAVKELLENAVDAGSTKIDLIIKDAGKTLIQVVDNGCGMTETDARMSFERHATSKIKNADDLFAIKTKGFRGEALASMAAIAHVELKTKIVDIDLGSQIIIEGSEIISQEPVSCNNGTSLSIKNLFYNVPARRNFLKSNGVETRHIIDEFERVALTHPDIHFIMNHNGNEVFNLASSGLRQRVVNVLGKKYNDRLVPIEEYTNILNVTGYIVKPEFSKRTRGEQFFFVNNRFIKSTYLNHSVTSAFRELIAKDQFPSYFIYLEVEPNTIDINIHPTKTEIKFEDEKSIYAIINSAVKNSLGKYNIAPSLDFTQETSFNVPPLKEGQTIVQPVIKVNPGFNPFETNKESSINSFKKKNISPQQLSANLDFLDQSKSLNVKSADNISGNTGLEQNWSGIVDAETEIKTYQLHQKFILTQTSSGLLIINQQRAHQQILFEQFIFELNRNTAETQKLMFPKTIELNNSDFELIREVLNEIKNIGFDIEVFGKNTLAINGLPIGVEEANCEKIIEEFIEQIKNNANEISTNNKNALAMSLARSSSIKNGRKLSSEEMNTLVDQLFACETPYHSPNGKPIIIKINEEELDQRFDKK